MSQTVGVLLGKLSGSNLHVWLSVTVGTVLFGLFGYSADAAMTSLNVPDDVHAGMVGAIVGVGAGLGFWIILAGLREQQQHLTDEVQRVAELNHAVRNSLEVITWATHVPDQQHRAVVLESTARIEEKLRQLFPVSDARRHSQKN